MTYGDTRTGYTENEFVRERQSLQSDTLTNTALYLANGAR